jgi:hypothetical protein
MLHKILNIVEEHMCDVYEKSPKMSLDFKIYLHEIKKTDGYLVLMASIQTSFDTVDEFCLNYLKYFTTMSTSIEKACKYFDQIIFNILRITEQVNDPGIMFLISQTSENFNRGILFCQKKN